MIEYERTNLNGVPDYTAVEFEGRRHDYCLLIPVINEGARILTELGRAQTAGVDTLCDIVICDGAGRDYKCRLVQTLEHEAEAEVIEVVPCKAEPTVRSTVFAGLPKGERSDFLVQKCTEAGASEIVFFSCTRCVAKAVNMEKKLERWQRIAEEAAKQSGRGIIPQVRYEADFVAVLNDALHTDLPLFAYDLPVCVHTKLDPTMLVTLGKDGVIQGVKDSSGDDVSFRWLVIENEDAGHPLQLLTGHEVCVDGAYLAGADGSVPGLANVDPDSYVAQWKAFQAGDWDEVKRLQDHLARLMFMTRKVKATVGFGAGVGAFKTALWQLGVFNTNQMREPVQPLVGDDVEHIVSVLKKAGLMDADAPIRK